MDVRLCGAGAVMLLALAIAPLPDRIAASGTPSLRGLYAEQSFGDVLVNDRLQALRDRCGAALRLDGRELQWRGRQRLYRVGDRVAVWEDRPTLTADDAGCTARLTLVRTVRVGAGAQALAAAGWQPPPRTCDRLQRCRTATIGGVAAICYDLGDGLVGSTRCLGAADDLSHGLKLANSSYSDDGSIPDSGWQMDRVLPDAAIDPVVFRQP